MRKNKMRNIFEKATKDKIRFEYKGQISTEDLWDLSVTELDTIFKKLNSKKKQITEDSLLEVKTSENVLLNTQIKIVTSIVEQKLAEKEMQVAFKERKEKKEKIMEILASKQDSDLKEKSTEELQEMLNSL